MLFLRWGKRFKHGRGGVRPNSDKALNSFLKGAARGSTLAMVDAGLLYWEMGNKYEAIALYQKAADLGDPSAKCNLGISFLHGMYNQSYSTSFSLLCFNLLLKSRLVTGGSAICIISAHPSFVVSKWGAIFTLVAPGLRLLQCLILYISPGVCFDNL